MISLASCAAADMLVAALIVDLTLVIGQLFTRLHVILFLHRRVFSLIRGRFLSRLLGAFNVFVARDLRFRHVPPRLNREEPRLAFDKTEAHTGLLTRGLTLARGRTTGWLCTRGRL